MEMSKRINVLRNVFFSRGENVTYQKEIKRKRGDRLCGQQLPLAALPSTRQA
jgi:hypothetical protein